jgi:hypothetical protein
MDQSYGKFKFAWGGGPPDATLLAGTVEFNKWQHVAAVMDGSKGYIYKNGVLQGSISTATPLPATAYNVIIGNNPTNVRDFYGLIGEVRIYNRALSDKEIYTLYVYGIEKLRQPRFPEYRRQLRRRLWGF